MEDKTFVEIEAEQLSDLVESVKLLQDANKQWECAYNELHDKFVEYVRLDMEEKRKSNMIGFRSPEKIKRSDSDGCNEI